MSERWGKSTTELLNEFVLKTNAINFDLCFSVFELESGYYMCAFVCVCVCARVYAMGCG